MNEPSSSAKRPSSAMEAVAKELTKLPGIGPRMAQRLTLALLRRPKKDIDALIEALTHLATDVRPCSACGNFDQSDPCSICSDTGRDRSTICVVEQQQDLNALERTNKYNGLYHILGGALSPIDGIGPEEIGIPRLLERLQEPVREVILATNPTLEGDATANYLQEIIAPIGVRVTRLARGLPSGSDLEYADELTLAMALSSRSELKSS